MRSSFADLHYYYGSPTAKPPHHRFDKGSYVYLFENAAQRRARLEVANNAGTPEQDAFVGCEYHSIFYDTMSNNRDQIWTVLMSNILTNNRPW
jgi:hypothetical protein